MEFRSKGVCVPGGLAHWFVEDSIRLECKDPREVDVEDPRGGAECVWCLKCGWLLGKSRLRAHA